MSERDKSQHLAVGAGAPSDPDQFAPGPSLVGDDDPATASATAPTDGPPPQPDDDHPLADDAVEAVVAFVDDLVVETRSHDAAGDDALSEESGTDE